MIILGLGKNSKKNRIGKANNNRKDKNMQDCHGRTIDYIRISVTDKCNLRCVYCMPEKSVTEKAHCDREQQILTQDELERLCRCFARLGISKIKITGGEPLMRRDVTALISRLKAVPGIDNLTLTTNGVLLKEQLPYLVEAGVDAVNISIDSLDEQSYEQISRRKELKRTLEGIEAALSYPDLVVKINCVPLKGMNDRQLADIALLAKTRNIHVRFIEMMPIGFGKQFACQTEEEIKHILEAELGKELTPYKGRLGNGPSHYYSVEGFQGKLGFISAVSHKFCSECNRVRLTCGGFLKTCLQYNIGCDLLALLRGGASDEQLTDAVYQTIYNKPLCHHFDEPAADSDTEQRSMSEIGG